MSALVDEIEDQWAGDMKTKKFCPISSMYRQQICFYRTLQLVESSFHQVGFKESRVDSFKVMDVFF